jgi:outer membrane cobalamin receptor
VVRRRVGTGPALALGGEFYRDDLESTNLGDRSEDRSAVFAEAAWAGGPVSVTGGLRMDHHEGFGEAWSPSVSASADLSANARVRASWGRSFRAPTWTDRYYVDPGNRGDPELAPERSWSAEAGADVALPGSGSLRVTAFRRDSEDLIDWVKPVGSPPGTQAVARNIESATFDGIEVGLEALALAGFVLDASGTLLSVESAEATGLQSRYALRPLTQQATLALTRTLLDGRLLLSGRVLHARRLPTQGTPGHGYELFGARALVRLPLGELTLDGTNLGDQGHVDVAGNPSAGRSLAVGYRVGLGAAR